MVSGKGTLEAKKHPLIQPRLKAVFNPQATFASGLRSDRCPPHGVGDQLGWALQHPHGGQVGNAPQEEPLHVTPRRYLTRGGGSIRTSPGRKLMGQEVNS